MTEPARDFANGLDALAHLLYCPTLGGRHCARARWHHRIHLIPGWLLALVCARRERSAHA